MNNQQSRRGNTQNVVICPPCGESVAVATKEGQNRKNALWPAPPTPPIGGTPSTREGDVPRLYTKLSS